MKVLGVVTLEQAIIRDNGFCVAILYMSRLRVVGWQ